MVRSAEKVMEEALPIAEQRRSALQQLLRSSQTADRIAPSAWGVSLLDNGFRLNVGRVEALGVFGDTIRVLVAASSEDARLANLSMMATHYKSVRGPQSAFVGSVPQFVAAWPVLQPFHTSFIEAAAKTRTGKPRNGTFVRFHSPELMDYAAAITASDRPKPATATPLYDFKVGSTYTRSDIFKKVGVEDHSGGPWFTGYTSHGPDYFVFCGVGTSGRTGHDYDNHFEGDHLVWHAKERSNIEQPSIQELLSPAGQVYLFYREHNRDPFVFAGLALPVEAFETTPVKVIWKFASPDGHALPNQLAEEVSDEQGPIIEGARKSVVVNIYERDPNARLRCIKRWGLECQACFFDFAKTYGALGDGFIHVHHLNPLSELRKEYILNPEEDLRPVCPNCHAMLHKERPAMKIEKLREILAKQGKT